MYNLLKNLIKVDRESLLLRIPIVHKNYLNCLTVRATSHLSVKLTAMPVTLNAVSSHLCKILTRIIVKTYLQTGRRCYCITQRPVVTCYNSAKLSETSKSIHLGGGGSKSMDGQGCAILALELVPKNLIFT